MGGGTAVQGAVAEAAFMTGIERNAEKVFMAAYAPLLANVRHVGVLCPTNLILYDNHRCALLHSLSNSYGFKHQEICYAMTTSAHYCIVCQRAMAAKICEYLIQYPQVCIIALYQENAMAMKYGSKFLR